MSSCALLISVSKSFLAFANSSSKAFTDFGVLSLSLTASRLATCLFAACKAASKSLKSSVLGGSGAGVTLELDSSADAFDSEVSLALDSAEDTFDSDVSLALDSAEEAFDSDVSLALDSAEEAFDSDD